MPGVWTRLLPGRLDKRQDKPAYETEFIACSACKVMQWSPGAEPKNKIDPPLLKTWGKPRDD